MARDGHANSLVIGGRGLGSDKWVVTSVSQVWEAILNKGELLSGIIDIALEEYISYL